MVYQTIQPSPNLREFIKDYLLIHFEFGTSDYVPIKPYPVCPKQGIIFYVRGFVVSSNPETGSSEKRAQTVIFGQPLYRQNLQLTKDYIAISVRFQPGALFKFLRIPMTAFVHKNEDAQLVLGKEIERLNDELANSTTYAMMLMKIEAFLWKKIQQQKINNHPVDKIGGLILQDPQGFSLDKFAKEACLSASQMERRFIQQMGVPPKFFARVCRFYQAFVMKQRKPDLSWLSVAWETGYHDYQHLVKDFKDFSGTTPHIIIEENFNSPDQHLKLNPNFKYD